MVQDLYRYDGEFQMGLKHGHGVLYDLIEHTKFWGEFKDGEKDGIGFEKRPGFLWGYNVEKNMWRTGIRKVVSLPHNEL